MKPIEQVKRENKNKASLIDAVIDLLGGEDQEEIMGTIEDIAGHGADAGWCGFTYTKDTCEFYRANRKKINDWIKDTAEEMGCNSSIELVKGLQCMEGETEENIGRCIYGGRLAGSSETDNSTDMVESGLAWFALEEVCRLFKN